MVGMIRLTFLVRYAIINSSRNEVSDMLGKSAREIVLEEIPEGDERNRASHAATVLMHRVPGYRPSDAARTIVARWKAGRLDTWDDIKRDANPGVLEPYTDSELARSM
jgi:hypothetical protein